MVSRFGFPDLFITFTCNPKWDEIKNALLKDQQPSDRPDIVTRVFYIKLKALLEDIEKNEIFGQVAVITHVVEFQKRGLPHAHILIILKSPDRLNSDPILIDQCVSAEIPDPNEDKELYDLVKTHMIHGPCGPQRPESVCMKDVDGTWCCKKFFPKPFCAETQVINGTYPQYRRRDLGHTVNVHNIDVSSQFVVPYNAYLLRKYQAHINVEVSCTFSSVKYLYKYFYKGHDRATVSVGQERSDTAPIHDEVTHFLDMRYVSAYEAAWRLYEFPLQGCNWSVELLHIHLPGQNLVYYEQGQEEQAANQASNDTKLLAWFKLNESDTSAHSLYYMQIPEFYSWDGKNHRWNRRKKYYKTIGRLGFVSPSANELFFLRTLLLHTPGATSYNFLLTVDGQLCSTFREAARLRGLLMDDTEWNGAMTEAVAYQMPRQLRGLFSNILVYCGPADPSKLWEDFADEMSQGLHPSPEIARSIALHLIARRVQHLDKDITDFGFVLPSLPTNIRFQQIIQDFDMPSVNPQQSDQPLPEPNTEQAHVISTIIDAIHSGTGGCFFMDGPGGTGKTFVYNHLVQRLNAMEKKVVCIASTGIAATLLINGRTAHSLFKIPIPTTEISTSSISAQTAAAQELMNTDLFIWDEAVMQHRFVFEAVNRLLQDLFQTTTPFGGKTILLGGDFRQILPVVIKGSRAQTVHAAISRSALWSNFRILRLTRNMRVNQNEIEFCDFLLQVGSGAANEQGTSKLQVPSQLILPPDVDFIGSIFGDLQPCNASLCDRAILCPHNHVAEKLNTKILNRMPGEFKEYLSVNQVVQQTDGFVSPIPPEVFNSYNVSGLPPHKLCLKKNAIIMLLRNLNVAGGLCNGTRLEVIELRPHVIFARILTGPAKGDRVFIPRITLEPSENNTIAKFSRRQFPVQLSFAMTINKAQGQTFRKVGVCLKTNVFSHGQLYVAFSRCTSMDSLVIELRPNQTFTDNIVYNEVLLH